MPSTWRPACRRGASYRGEAGGWSWCPLAARRSPAPPGHWPCGLEGYPAATGLCSAAGRDQAGLVGQHDGLDTVAEVELGQDPADMDRDGAFGQVQLGGDLADGLP